MHLDLHAIVKEAATLADGRSALDTNNFAVIITDIGLPDGNAESWVTEMLAAGHKGVIISSGHAVDGELAMHVEAKAVGVLGKPYELNDVERCLAERK